MLKDTLNRCNLNTLASALQKIAFGQTLRQDVKITKRKVNPNALGTNAYNLATLQVIVLPDDAKAAVLLRAFARTGTAGTGEMTVAARHATPTTGQIAVTPSGDIALLAADAITDVDVEYLAARYDVVELTLPVATNVLAIPAAFTDRGVLEVAEVEALDGGATGAKIILTPGGSATAGKAALNVAKTQVNFAAADAVTRARVKLLVAALADLDALLESTSAELI